MPTTRSQSMPMIGGFKAGGTYFATGTPASGVSTGPVGQAAMTWFCVVKGLLDTIGFRQIGLARTNFAGGGWGIYEASARWYATVFSSAAAQVFPNPNDYQRATGLYLMIVNSRVAAGPALQVRYWLNGVLAGTTSAGNGSFASYSGPVCLGVASSTLAGGYSNGFFYGDQGVLYDYDPDAYSSSYGTGATGLTAQWWDDLRQGRYLTWPRAGAANTDWYWAARDVVDPSVVKPTWTDRYTGTVMTRTGNLQPAMIKAAF